LTTDCVPSPSLVILSILVKRKAREKHKVAQILKFLFDSNKEGVFLDGFLLLLVLVYKGVGLF
jgi:hypothetical protein